MHRPVFIITGASQGIGAAAAAVASEKGAQVVLVARNKLALERETDQIRERGGMVLVVVGDISRYDVCQEIVTRTIQAFGRIDAVINNAALISPLSPVADLPPDEWAHTLEVNLLGPVLLCREAIPYLRETNGRVINISSAASVVAVPGGSAYCVSKAAINHFSKILCIEEPSITVIAFNPGDVDTPMQAEIRERGDLKVFEEINRYCIDLYEQGQLLSSGHAALAVVTLALASPAEWSGEYISYDDERIQNLIRDYGALSRQK